MMGVRTRVADARTSNQIEVLMMNRIDSEHVSSTLRGPPHVLRRVREKVQAASRNACHWPFPPEKRK